MNSWTASVIRIGRRPLGFAGSAAVAAGRIPERVSITRDVVVDTGLRVSGLCHQANVGDLRRVGTYTALQVTVKGAITLKTKLPNGKGVASGHGPAQRQVLLGLGLDLAPESSSRKST